MVKLLNLYCFSYILFGRTKVQLFSQFGKYQSEKIIRVSNILNIFDY